MSEPKQQACIQQWLVTLVSLVIHLQEATAGPAEVQQADEAAANELERVFSKSSFSRMEVLGQFNLGFIVARLHNDLFMLDQHACDEKYNFERLQRETVLNRQPLLAPQPLDLSPSEAILLRCG